MPRFNLIYYTALLDLCFIKFFDAANSCFVKVGEDYVLSSKFQSKNKIKSFFRKQLYIELKELCKPYSAASPQYYLVIGACMPKDNLLLKFANADELPEKLKKAANADFQAKWLLKEHDIKIDIALFNQALYELFDEFFTSSSRTARWFGKNVIFVQHKRLDCYTLFKTIKSIYGRSNCWNLQKEKLYMVKSPLVAINDLIDRYVHDKVAMSKSPEFRRCLDEVKQFLEEKIREIHCG